MVDVHGTCDERFEAVAQTFAANLESGADLGASVAVLVDGEPVVDLRGGHLDGARTIPWVSDTIVNVWSTTKTMVALCVLVLADRGQIDLHAPVARYWPEFAAGGKEAIEIRHLMSHTAGLSGWDQPLAVADLEDWERCTSALAAQQPWWPPGQSSGYHAVTFGYLLGEVVRRVTGTTIGSFLATEIAGPLGADFHVGLDPVHDQRVSPLVPPPSLEAQLAALAPDSLTMRTLANPPLTAEAAMTAGWRRAEIPGANGHGNARSVAAVQSVLAGSGQARGVRLLSDTGWAPVFDEQAHGTDLVLGVPLRFGIGYGLSSELVPLGARSAFWGGWGGSMVVVDLDTSMTFAYVMNRMASGLVGDERGSGLLLAAAGAAAGT